jgi:hypothetical protein
LSVSLLPRFLPGVADLQQELSLARELQDVVVFLRAAAQPDVVVAVDEDAVRRAEPLVAVPGAPHACRNFPLESNSSTAEPEYSTRPAEA